jgi:GTPase-associated protein 1, N-terminal domain type 2
MQIEQAIYGSQGGDGYRFLARSAGFRDDWLPEAERLCMGFGERPAGVACPGCVFAQPFGRHQVAIVQAADQGRDDAGRPGALAFHVLVVPRPLYLDLGGDPFHIAEQFPPLWAARGEQPVLSWTAGAPPARTVALLQQTLNVPYSATLLGGVQILLDGGKLVFERSEPDAAILRSLWMLLPTSTRSELWPASFIFSNIHHFDVVVVPRAAGSDYDHYVTEEKAGDYPEGRYECNLQSAIETGDTQEIDALLNRRSRSQTLRLAAVLLLMVIGLSVGMAVLVPSPRPARPASTSAKAMPVLDLPPANECPTLDASERTQLAERLQELGKRLHVKLPRGTSDKALTDTLAALDKHLGTPDSRRDPGPLRDLGPLQRQLRALLWKHAVTGYNKRGFNMMELLERLQQSLDQQRNRTEPFREQALPRRVCYSRSGILIL